MAVERKTHSAVDRASDTVQASTERAARAAHEAAESLGEYGTRAKEQLRETGRAAGERSREIVDQLTDYISEHPMTALGIAVAVGFVLGTVVGRSSSGTEELS